MAIQTSTANPKKAEENSRLATLPYHLQEQILRYLERGDFRAAKALFDAGLKSPDKH